MRSLGLGLGLETFAKFFRVSVSVSENLVSEKKSWFRFQRIWSRKKSQFRFGEFGPGKKFWFWKICTRKKSVRFGFGKLGLGILGLRKEKIKITRKKLDQVNKSPISITIFFVLFLSIKWRKAKTVTLTLTFYPEEKKNGEEKGGKYSEKENIFLC